MARHVSAAENKFLSLELEAQLQGKAFRELQRPVASLAGAAQRDLLLLLSRPARQPRPKLQGLSQISFDCGFSELRTYHGKSGSPEPHSGQGQRQPDLRRC